MHLTTLTLEQFRSYKSQELTFSSTGATVLVGDNGAGKTNILEAISILSLCKSCLKVDEADLMQWGEDYYRIAGATVSDEGGDTTLEVVSQVAPRKEKACFVNDVRTPVNGVLGQLPTVTFLPQELELFTGAPANRRAFLDQLLSQVSSEYLQMLVTYQKILKQRNASLRHIASGQCSADGLPIWNEKLADVGSQITLKRLELTKILQCALEQELTSLGESWTQPEIVYERKGSETELQAAKEEMLTLLQANQQKDLLLQSTSVGPHREDWHIAVDGRSLQSFASRGQMRTAVLALLFLEVSYLELQRNEKPVILLDDVFSELDDNHQTSLLASLKHHQVIITTTHIPSSLHGANAIRVENGTVKQETMQSA